MVFTKRWYFLRWQFPNLGQLYTCLQGKIFLKMVDFKTKRSGRGGKVATAGCQPAGVVVVPEADRHRLLLHWRAGSERRGRERKAG